LSVPPAVLEPRSGTAAEVGWWRPRGERGSLQNRDEKIFEQREKERKRERKRKGY